MALTLFLPVQDQSHVSEARRLACAAARDAGLDEESLARAALVVTEAARNILKHAGSGEVLVTALPGALTILALDRGPGMPDVDRCVGDGYSTAGSPGTGLGAIQRASTAFEVCSAPGRGTVLWARVGAPESGAISFAEIVRAHPAESVSGDAVFVRPTKEGAVAAVVDGLGHGPEAHRAATEAIGVLEHHAARREPAALLGIVHDVLHSTRGAAMAVARLDLAQGRVRYAGVGNISGVLLSPSGARNLISHPGTLGHEARKIHELDYPWPEGAALVMHSDGLSSHWHLDACPGLVAAHPELVAGVLYRDHCRGRDDASVLVVRETGR